MVWLDKAKQIIADFVPKNSSMRILTTAYKDKDVFLECVIMEEDTRTQVVWIGCFDDYGKLRSVRSYGLR